MSKNVLPLINIACMCVATSLAYTLPFELLLFSYAFIGPAHYLTEISWLHDRGYFTKGSKDYLFLVISTVGILLVPSSTISDVLLILSFAAAGVFAYTNAEPYRALSVVVLAGLITIMRKVFGFGQEFSVLLCSIIHVYVFTGAFILYGALKRKNLADFLSLCMFLACGLSFFIVAPNYASYTASESILENIEFFKRVNRILLDLIGRVESKQNMVSVMAFLSFAYSYHYLNWFSKTRLIRWHEISVDRAVLVISVYVLSIAVYLYDYFLGFYMLLGLSLLHVLLEFPLNHHTFVGIGTELKKLVRRE